MPGAVAGAVAAALHPGGTLVGLFPSLSLKTFSVYFIIRGVRDRPLPLQNLHSGYISPLKIYNVRKSWDQRVDSVHSGGKKHLAQSSCACAALFPINRSIAPKFEASFVPPPLVYKGNPKVTNGPLHALGLAGDHGIA
jgi:hypothetical protein